jgi:putative ABC transport system permease protein
MLESLYSDLRSAARGLARSPGFTIVAGAILAIGIAATTVMFALVQGVLLRPLPLPEQERLVLAWKDQPRSGLSHHPFGDRDIDRIASASRLFKAVAGVDANGAGREVIADEAEASYVHTALVTGGFFGVLEIEPVLGRTLGPADDVDGAERTVVISHALWQRRYGGSHAVIGRRITLGDERFAIVGVMPAGVDYPTGVEIWRTTHSVLANGPFGDAARREVDLVGRLQPGVTIPQATAELIALNRRLEDEAAPGAPRGLVPVLHRFEDVVVGRVRPALVWLMAAVSLVLIIASANVANLLLLRGDSRRAELAVREALGARRGRIVRLLLMEGGVITVAAATVGLLIARWILQAVLTLLPDGLPRLDSIRIDVGVTVFVVLVALATSAMAGLAPALTLGRADLVTALTGGGRGASGASTGSLRRTLVVAQIALAVLMLSAAGVLIRSVLHLQSLDTGFAGERLVFVDLAVSRARLADRPRHAQFLRQAVARLESYPSIPGATPVNAAPFSEEGGWDVVRFTVEGQTDLQSAANPALNFEAVYPNYFATLGIAVQRGRAFAESDRSGGLAVAIVSDDLAARLWPAGVDPIGKRLKLGRSDSAEPWRLVVGVAAATRYRDLARPRPTLYLPAAQFLDTAQRLVIRSAASLDIVASLAREEIRAIDPGVRTMRVAPFSEMLARPLARPRFNMLVLTIFAVAALLLSAVGLHAVMTAYVRERDREIAVRIALGATPGRVRRLVLREALGLVVVGGGLGLAGAVIVVRLAEGMFQGQRPADPASFVGTTLVWAAAALLAIVIPVRQASRLDAVALLRR